jgi:hypothetical protein
MRTIGSASSILALAALAALAALSALTLAPARAAANADLEEAERLYLDARFEGTLEALARAEAADQLTREELVRLLRRRVLTLFALGEEARLEEALEALAILAPDSELGVEAGPALSRRFAAIVEARLPAEVEVSTAGEPGSVVLEARALHAAPLVRRVVVHARVGDGPWIDAEERLVLAPPPGAAVEYHAEALGPGGVRVAREGTPGQPLAYRAPGATADPDPAVDPVEDAGDEGPWIALGIVSGVVLVAGVVAAVVAAAVYQPDTVLDPVLGELRLP